MVQAQEWRELAQQLRVDSIRSTTAAGSGHPTSSMSAADLMAVLLAMLIVVSLPSALLRPWIALLLGAGVFVLVALLLNRLAGLLPRLTLPAALRWCWWRALPLGVAGLVYLMLV